MKIIGSKHKSMCDAIKAVELSAKPSYVGDSHGANKRDAIKAIKRANKVFAVTDDVAKSLIGYVSGM